MNDAVGTRLGSLKTVPVSSAVCGPGLLTATSTRPTKLLTGLPETSRTETVGWVVKATLFTAPVASVVKTSCVARPCDSSIDLSPVRVVGLEMVAVIIFPLPAKPVSLRLSKVAVPELAKRVVVPESVAPLAVRTIDWLASEPDVTRFWLASRI